MRIYTVTSSGKRGRNFADADPKKTGRKQGLDPFQILLVICSVLGLHLLRENADGSFALCRWRLVPMAILGLVSLAHLAGALVYLALVSPPLWLVVLLVPPCLSFCFCVLTFAQVYRNARALAGYLPGLSALGVEGRRASAPEVASCVLFPVGLVAGACYLLPTWHLFLPSLFVASCVPAVMDVYIMHFVKVLKAAYEALGRDVSSRGSITFQEVQVVAERWLTLTETVAAHNKIFNVILHCRLWLLVLQSMAHLFFLWALRHYYGPCLSLLLLTLTPLAELVLRFLYLCNHAEALSRADEKVVEAVQEATVRVPTGSLEHLGLSAFSCHMVAQPAAVHVWGMDSLSSSTFVSLAGVVLTYLVVILQFSLKVNYDFTGEDEAGFDEYSECFAEESQDGVNPFKLVIGHLVKP
ncbi:uncharacterized protein [Penaeus vannamei]|uniref:uncharacterized protein n=1 Tax=Penaeus vannamei TaxID=6689 RepID=UPI00387F5B14